MKNSVSPAVVIGALVVIVLIVGLLAYRLLFSNTDASPNSAAAKRQYEETHTNSAIRQHMGGGGPGGAVNQNVPGPRGAYGQTGGN